MGLLFVYIFYLLNITQNRTQLPYTFILFKQTFCAYAPAHQIGYPVLLWSSYRSNLHTKLSEDEDRKQNVWPWDQSEEKILIFFLLVIAELKETTCPISITWSAYWWRRPTTQDNLILLTTRSLNWQTAYLTIKLTKQTLHKTYRNVPVSSVCSKAGQVVPKHPVHYIFSC